MKEEEAHPADASSLIYLAKCDAFTDLERFLPGLLVPPAVWEEAVEAGERIGAPDVTALRRAFDRGFLRRIGLRPAEARRAATLAETHRLGRGESEVLTMGRRFAWCVVDEGRASRVAATLGVATLPTLLLPVLGHRSGRMDAGEAMKLVRRLAVVAGARAEAVFAIEAELSGGSG
jgi:predicted nucleic acid-binding protein